MRRIAMPNNLCPGLEAEYSYIVEERHLAHIVGSGLVSVFSTAMMIAGMEAAAVEAVQAALEEGYTTVGVHVDVWHKAPTPLGMKVRFKAVLEKVSEDGRKLLFRVQALDESCLIGEGLHERVLVHKGRFENRALAKKSAS